MRRDLELLYEIGRVEECQLAAIEAKEALAAACWGAHKENLQRQYNDEVADRPDKGFA